MNRINLPNSIQIFLACDAYMASFIVIILNFCTSLYLRLD